MSEIRENLKPYANKRVKVRGILSKWDDHWLVNNREMGRTCIANPEIEGVVVAHHVWVVSTPHWKKFKEDMGQQVAFDAVVQPYVDRNSRQTNYCLNLASDLEFLHLPALKIPELPPEEEDDQMPREMPHVEISAVEKIKITKAFIKACGDYDPEKVLGLIGSLPNLPVAELIELIQALKD